MLPPELWYLISSYINDGRTWKAFTQTCSMFNDLQSEDKILQFSNPVWTLVTKFPDKNWDWEVLSANDWITFNIVYSNPDKPWKWEILMQRLKFPEEFLFETMEVMKDFPIDDEYDYETHLIYIKTLEHVDYLSLNKSLPEKFVQEYYKIFDHCRLIANTPWSVLEGIKDFTPCDHICLNTENEPHVIEQLGIFDFHMLSYNTKITLGFFEKYLYQDWDFHILSHNPIICVEFICLAPDEEWDWYVLSNSTNVVAMYRRYPDKPWDYEILSNNKALTLELILEYKNKPWFMDRVSSAIRVSIQDIRKTPELKWDYIGLLSNDNIPLEELLSEFTLLENGLIIHNSIVNTTMHHHLAMLSYQDALDINPTLKYGSQDLLSYRDHSMRDIKNHPEIDWDFEAIGYNPALAWTYVADNSELFDFSSISHNTFAKYKK